MQSVSEQIDRLDYDVCVLTGDFRAGYGSFQLTLEGMAKIRNALREPVYGVLGNHDTIRMVPVWKRWEFKCCSTRSRQSRAGNQAIHLAGIDDAHSYRVHDIGKVASQIPKDGFLFCCPIRPKFSRKRLRQVSTCCSAGTPMGGKFACPVEFPSPSMRFCRGIWELVLGSSEICMDTRRSAPAPAFCPFASIVRRK